MGSKIIVCLLLLTLSAGCIGPRNRCDPGLSPACGNAQTLWQQAIDSIVTANFPNEFGKYQAVIWQDAFDNAWVTKGREVNITQQLILKLDPRQRLCVAAHELAHLKMGHYYSKMGIILVSPNSPASLETGSEPFPHYGASKNIQIPEGFGKNQEKEADRLALQYIKRLGLNRWDYINLLRLFLENPSDTASPTAERIRFIQILKD